MTAEREVLARARDVFLSDRRVDMQSLARDLGIGRATLYRLVGSREELLDRLLGELAGEFFEASRRQVGDGSDRPIAEMVEVIAATTTGLQPLRGFVGREPTLALRLLLGEGGSVRRRLLADVHSLVAELYPEEAEQLRGYSAALVQVGLALVWPTLAVGDEPSPTQVAAIAEALLVGARAGLLPPGPEHDHLGRPRQPPLSARPSPA
ncbi:MAG: QsdR family transcriptional regulator [Syntrophothermus sp.]